MNSMARTGSRMPLLKPSPRDDWPERVRWFSQRWPILKNNQGAQLWTDNRGSFISLPASIFAVLTTQFLGALNDNIFKNARSYYCYPGVSQAASNTNFLTNLAAGLFILPYFLFSTTAGQLADKFDEPGQFGELNLPSC